MSNLTHDLKDPGANWCPDCGEMRGVCTCAPELPFAGYWDWYEDLEDEMDDYDYTEGDYGQDGII